MPKQIISDTNSFCIHESIKSISQKCFLNLKFWSVEIIALVSGSKKSGAVSILLNLF